MHGDPLQGFSRMLMAVFFLSAPIVPPLPAFAEGALAIGNPPDVVHQGFAYGVNVNSPDDATARERALNGCKTTSEAPDSARNLCTIVTGFHHQCASVAMDPGAGTPGVGWAIGTLEADADQQALNNCMVTAGEDRRSYCKVVSSNCDS